jgi:hypothetical protein
MTSCVQAEDGIEGGGGKLIWVVGVEEPCRGNELAGAPDLPGAEVTPVTA